MSQEDARSTATLSPEELTPVDPEALVTTYADSLITELFDDVDRILDGDEAALAAVTCEPVKSATIDTMAEATSEDGPADAPQGLPIAEPLPSADAPLASLGSDLDFFRAEDVDGAAPPAAKTAAGKLIDRLLLGVTALSLLGVAGLLWFNQQTRWTVGRSANPDPVSQSDAEFLAYLQRSLQVIADKVDQGEASDDLALGQLPNGAVVPTPMLPPLGAGGTVGTLGSGPINVIERVYIPYQTGAAPVGQMPTAVAPVPGTPPAAAPGGPVAAAPSAAPAALVHSLVGVLELGDRSAALFNINGVSQRVYIGERVGSSGWSLVSVSNEQAVIRRNGEVRSIYIGQRF